MLADSAANLGWGLITLSGTYADCAMGPSGDAGGSVKSPTPNKGKLVIFIDNKRRKGGGWAWGQKGSVELGKGSNVYREAIVQDKPFLTSRLL